tara:strand:- start:1106 stop:1219 length:114 start_codon:yes stop_codon:yes gene_type:complete
MKYKPKRKEIITYAFMYLGFLSIIIAVFYNIIKSIDL